MISFSQIGQVGQGQVSSICDIRDSFSSGYEISGMRCEMRFPNRLYCFISLSFLSVLPGWALACPGSDQINQRPVYRTRSEARGRRLIEEPGRSLTKKGLCSTPGVGWLEGIAFCRLFFPSRSSLSKVGSSHTFCLLQAGLRDCSQPLPSPVVVSSFLTDPIGCS